MDYRRLPGDPQYAQDFSWDAFLADPRRDEAAEGEDSNTRERVEDSLDPVLRNVGALLITGLVLAGAPHVWPELTHEVSSSLAIALSDLRWISPADFLDLEIPIRHFAE